MTQLKAYFLIINVVVAIVAFSWMVSGYVRLSELGTGEWFNTDTQKFYKTEADALANTNPVTYNPPSVSPVPTAGQAGTVGSGFVGNTKFSLPTDAPLKNIPYTGPGADGTILKEVSGATTLPDGRVAVTYDAGKSVTTVPSAEGQQIIKEAGLQSSDVIAKAKTDVWSLSGETIINNAVSIGAMFGLGYLIGGFIGGNADIALGSAFALGTAIYQLGSGAWGSAYKFANAGWWGIGIGAAIFVFMYKDTTTEVVEFNCLPYQPPVGGADCEKCNFFEQCSEYTCKSLGQACQLLNAGTDEESCAWVNPHDVNSPKIKISEVLKGYKWIPDTAVRPPATGAVISQTNGDCIKAFTPLEFTIASDEPSQCKIDYNLTNGFDEMTYYIGGTNIYSYNHTEKMSLPSPSAINAISPLLKNDGTYTLYVRCRDANGNFNQDAYSLRFCVEKGPDTTPPRIDSLSIPSNNPLSYNTSKLYLEVYVNEPSQCKWSREDRDFKQMENNMTCNTNLWEINNNNVYTCKTTLTGIKNMQDNEYYFRCKDQPNAPESERNVNVQSYLYNVIGTQPLNIIEIKPSNETIKGATDTIAVNLEVKTDNGYNNGESFCYYTTTKSTSSSESCIGQEDTYIMFADTGNNNEHVQRQDLVTGDYTYYIKCIDLGGNAAYDCTKFSVEVDRSAPIVVRAYKESEQLKVVTNEEADCSYSNKDCNFEIKDGIKMTSFDNEAHTTEWLITKNYYIRCNDKYGNQPNPNTCSAVIRPYKFIDKGNVIEL